MDAAGRLCAVRLFFLLSPARGRGGVRGMRTIGRSSKPPHLASPPSGGEEYEEIEGFFAGTAR
jgi:hypothetical protein